MKTYRYCAAFSMALISTQPAQAAMVLPSAADSYSLGVEGFYDRYREPLTDVTQTTDYGSVTGTYMHNFGGMVGALDGRASYGRDHYASADGTDSGIPQYEAEGRMRLGTNITSAGGSVLFPYVGGGVRYFVDKSKDTLTSLGFSGYDRRITQFYAPVGATYTCNLGGGWVMAPTAEYDQLISGNVNSRLQNDNGYNINNSQHSGYGMRGEVMFGQDSNGHGWEFGPFVRYWNIKDSDIATAPDASQWIEPANTRLQAGLALKVLW